MEAGVAALRGMLVFACAVAVASLVVAFGNDRRGAAPMMAWVLLDLLGRSLFQRVVPKAVGNLGTVLVSMPLGGRDEKDQSQQEQQQEQMCAADLFNSFVRRRATFETTTMTDATRKPRKRPNEDVGVCSRVWKPHGYIFLAHEQNQAARREDTLHEKFPIPPNQLTSTLSTTISRTVLARWFQSEAISCRQRSRHPSYLSRPTTSPCYSTKINAIIY